jgi:hypothetical protein
LESLISVICTSLAVVELEVEEAVKEDVVEVEVVEVPKFEGAELLVLRDGGTALPGSSTSGEKYLGFGFDFRLVLTSDIISNE